MSPFAQCVCLLFEISFSHPGAGDELHVGRVSFACAMRRRREGAQPFCIDARAFFLCATLAASAVVSHALLNPCRGSHVRAVRINSSLLRLHFSGRHPHVGNIISILGFDSGSGER
jgi:hypothetical protein